MILGVPREAHLTNAKETFLLDCRAAGLKPKTMRSYRDVLTAFIAFSGDMLVRELGPDHVRTYIAELTDRAGHREGETFSSRSLMKHYAVVRTWVRWMYAQKIVTQRDNEIAKVPRLPTRNFFFY
jgi:site-specific recombinase XerD